ncbi:MAG: NADH-quinone oxidoreductase subunit NuoF [Ruminococcaceae bacterium]|nr:NADH-quinone oxidoreductase subunit NuoF [Oscillospiraceae bacterium]
MRIAIGEGSCGIAAGAKKLEEALIKSAEGKNIGIGITGCVGMCFLEPIVDIYEDKKLLKRLVKVKESDAERIVSAAEKGDFSSVSDLEIKEEDSEFLELQKRIALKNCGKINPESIEDYIAEGGYESLKKVLGIPPEKVIDEIKLSGLAGRGGAGFPTWLKWDLARKNKSENGRKYLICNADEGDPGAFMDRAIIESDPHSLIEGMLIAAYAIGAYEAFVYVRAEYPLAVKHLEKAIEQAKKSGFIGENIFGADFSCDIKIKTGAGAFVCGEETALIASLEGERGMPKLKPPFPAESGYKGAPSNINNVETFANVPRIIKMGGKAFSEIGTENSKGTKVFALTGKVKRSGLVEVPMGTTLREVIYKIGGGIKGEKKFKAVQLGGPSGGCIPENLLDTPIDYKELSKTGAIMGSGGMVVMDESACMVGMAKFFLDFTAEESCGKCVHCRIGTKRMQEILTAITEGKGKPEDIETLEELCDAVKEGALCGLGQTAPNPVLTTLRYFRNEYEEHVFEHRCAAKECSAMLSYVISAEKCRGCTLCAKKCPVSAISGEVKKTHIIDKNLCIRCGACSKVCPFGAVSIE